MPRIICCVLLALLAGTVTAGSPTSDGRYQAVVLHSAGAGAGAGSISPKVFILDTRDGHMWTWEQNAHVQRGQGGLSFGNILTYQGRLRPGRQPGEVIGEAK